VVDTGKAVVVGATVVGIAVATAVDAVASERSWAVKTTDAINLNCVYVY
jgi:hypothetical protein